MNVDIEAVCEHLQVEESCGRLFSRAILARESGNDAVYWPLIRQIWEANMEAVLAGKADRYFVDWSRIFTPIEELTWADIRSYPVYFFPQVPVGRRFVDFGDPILKVAIECDGRAYHNTLRDTLRDLELAEHGWTVYHLTGSECSVRELPEYPTEEELGRWMLNSPDGLILSILQHHYGVEISKDRRPYVDRCLEKHLLVRRAYG